jgi:hypothetical protein
MCSEEVWIKKRTSGLYISKMLSGRFMPKQPIHIKNYVGSELLLVSGFEVNIR